MTAAELADRIGAKHCGAGWIARCPAHDDHNASLSLSEGRDGRTLVKCHAGCDFSAIVGAMGLMPSDLFPPTIPGTQRRIVATYDYTDEDDKLLFQVCRFEPKNFRQRRPDLEHSGAWLWNMQNVDRVLYRLPDVLRAVTTGETVFVVEGEKDVEALAALGLTATCNSGGAGKWADSYTAALVGADVVILPDRDAPGRKHGALVARALQGNVESLKVIELPDRDGHRVKDAADWIEAGGTRGDLEALIEAAERQAEGGHTPVRANLPEPDKGRGADNTKTAASPTTPTAMTGKPDFESIRARLWELAQAKLSATELYRNSAAAVVEWLHGRGRFYFHAERRDFASVMLFDAERKLLLPVQSDDFLAWLADAMAVNRSERLFLFVASAVETEGLSDRSTGITPAAYWAARPGACYISNGPGSMARVSAGRVEIVDNGTDEILFPYGATLPPWTLTEPRDPFDGCDLFRNMATAAPHGPMLFRLWAVSLPTDPACKPPLCVTAPAGAGKTAAIRGLFRLYGPPEQVAAVTRNGDGDFWAALDGGGLYCLDNADVRTDWLPDAAAAAATAGAQLKRRLYTDADRVTLRARAWLAITSLNPTFAADAGLADRLLVVRLNRRTGETAESALFEEITVARDAGLSWIVFTLAGALADRADVPRGLNQRHPDFAALAVRIGRAMGREAEAVNALRAAEADKSLFNIENDTIGAVLLEAMQEDRFTGTTAELLERLKAVDPSLEGTLSVKRLAKRIEKLWPHLEATFKARKEKGHGGINQLVLFPPAAGGFGGFETAFPEKSLRERELGDFYGNIDSNQPNQPSTPTEQEFDL